MIIDRRAREWISGFLLLGILVGLLGSLLIAWQYHIDTDPQLIGLHFLALNAGYVIGVGFGTEADSAISDPACGADLVRNRVRKPGRLDATDSPNISFVASDWPRIHGIRRRALSRPLCLYVLAPHFAESPAAVANQKRSAIRMRLPGGDTDGRHHVFCRFRSDRNCVTGDRSADLLSHLCARTNFQAHLSRLLSAERKTGCARRCGALAA